MAETTAPPRAVEARRPATSAAYRGRWAPCVEITGNEALRAPCWSSFGKFLNVALPHRLGTITDWDGVYSESCSPDPPNSFGKSFSFGRPSCMGKYRLGVVDVEARGEPQRWQHGCEDICQPDRRMVVHQVATAVVVVVRWLNGVF